MAFVWVPNRIRLIRLIDSHLCVTTDCVRFSIKSTEKFKLNRSNELALLLYTVRFVNNAIDSCTPANELSRIFQLSIRIEHSFAHFHFSATLHFRLFVIGKYVMFFERIKVTTVLRWLCTVENSLCEQRKLRSYYRIENKSVQSGLTMSIYNHSKCGFWMHLKVLFTSVNRGKRCIGASRVHISVQCIIIEYLISTKLAHLHCPNNQRCVIELYMENGLTSVQ